MVRRGVPHQEPRACRGCPHKRATLQSALSGSALQQTGLAGLAELVLQRTLREGEGLRERVEVAAIRLHDDLLGCCAVRAAREEDAVSHLEALDRLAYLNAHRPRQSGGAGAVRGLGVRHVAHFTDDPGALTAEHEGHGRLVLVLALRPHAPTWLAAVQGSELAAGQACIISSSGKLIDADLTAIRTASSSRGSWRGSLLTSTIDMPCEATSR